MYASTGEPKFKERADLLVAELAKCQAKLGKSGYLSAFPEEVFAHLETGKPAWVPWYTMHKIMAGLFDIYQYCDNRQALEVLTKMAAWAKSRVDKLRRRADAEGP